MPFSLGNKTVTRVLINITFGVDPSRMTPRPPMGQASPENPACLRALYIEIAYEFFFLAKPYFLALIRQKKRNAHPR